MYRFCPLTQEFMDETTMIKASENLWMNPVAFLKWIYSLNLGIDLRIASLEEWILTAQQDTFKDINILRLRNPLTNLPFSKDDLIHIYYEYNITTFQYITIN